MLTLIITLISTILSIITSTLCTFVVKEALQHHLSGPITLFKRSSAEPADLGVAMEISQAVSPHVGSLCDGRIFAHKLEHLAPTHPHPAACEDDRNGTRLGICCFCKPVEHGLFCAKCEWWYGTRLGICCLCKPVEHGPQHPELQL
ncbi:hypothetical protein BDR04DRAFT_163160 [Suillus decipiens]|nr:hypothetical protein BDR04DRAFT_163160 [Suillus decipiens]